MNCPVRAATSVMGDQSDNRKISVTPGDTTTILSLSIPRRSRRSSSLGYVCEGLRPTLACLLSPLALLPIYLTFLGTREETGWESTPSAWRSICAGPSRPSQPQHTYSCCLLGRFQENENGGVKRGQNGTPSPHSLLPRPAVVAFARHCTILPLLSLLFVPSPSTVRYTSALHPVSPAQHLHAKSTASRCSSFARDVRYSHALQALVLGLGLEKRRSELLDHCFPLLLLTFSKTPNYLRLEDAEVVSFAVFVVG
ncbi:hypothetical protein K438DRAFT_1967326 [Mycena galopus ATCC 62051]|nr:hypothetical protein K438DRAFT_1967326 [Mycena galopus ATCC 62051]